MFQKEASTVEWLVSSRAEHKNGSRNHTLWLPRVGQNILGISSCWNSTFHIIDFLECSGLESTFSCKPCRLCTVKLVQHGCSLREQCVGYEKHFTMPLSSSSWLLLLLLLLFCPCHELVPSPDGCIPSETRQLMLASRRFVCRCELDSSTSKCRGMCFANRIPSHWFAYYIWSVLRHSRLSWVRFQIATDTTASSKSRLQNNDPLIYQLAANLLFEQLVLVKFFNRSEVDNVIFVETWTPLQTLAAKSMNVNWNKLSWCYT